MKHALKIPAWEIRFEATRSGGPGGQHVNKTSSAVILRWCVHRTGAFTPQEKLRLMEKLSQETTSEGDIMIRSEEFRSQEDNRRRCIEKLDQLLDRALFVPKPRKKTRPTRGSVARRVDKKKRDSEKKAGRQKVKF